MSGGIGTTSLFVVPTPIGNLEDITLRAIRILGEVDEILAEDTRVTQKLLRHLGISTPLRSFHAYNEHIRVAGLVEEMLGGKRMALVSDAGTPGISDPCYSLIQGCIAGGLGITCLPGPTALIPALVLSGLAMSSFVFLGFPPRKGKRYWEDLLSETRTMIIYESPHRLAKTLNVLTSFFPAERRIAVLRELSKLYEEVYRGTVADLCDHFSQTQVRGELVIVLEGKPKSSRTPTQ
ncbi:MAG: 16S rRNA (cytidine(1402)-2'-O)-methyltransferase [Cytophagales bacterium]|nr:16S rRNA (cytidine(1402)-2'-O)-methyltransferase [Cytophagales bacterium]